MDLHIHSLARYCGNTILDICVEIAVRLLSCHLVTVDSIYRNIGSPRLDTRAEPQEIETPRWAVS